MTTYPPPFLIRNDLLTPYATLNYTASIPQTTTLTSTGQVRPALLFIHGNSSSSQIFRDFFFPPPSKSSASPSPPSPPLSQTHRLIAFDLPGHGTSTNLAPHLTYSMPLYARITAHLISYLELDSLIILGWSLGGHIGIELTQLLGPKIKGLMLVGTPPVPRGQPQLGFYMDDATDHMGAAETESLDTDDISAFARAVAGEKFGGKYEPWMRADVARTEGRARSEMWAAFRAGEGVDQQAVMEAEKGTLLAVVNGAEEPFVRIDYLDTVKWGRLWRGKCVRLEGLGHAPFWERWVEFEGMFKEFVAECER